MLKKFKFTNIVSLVFAALVTIVLVIACGNGSPDGMQQSDFDDSVLVLTDKDNIDSILVKSSSSFVIVSSASGSSSSGESSSSVSSSSTAGVSSSGALLSSSAESPYILTCEMVVDTASAAHPIPEENRPRGICKEKVSGNIISLDPQLDYRWQNSPIWAGPAAGDFNIKVVVYPDAKACQDLTATCEGTFRVCEGGCAVVSSSSSAAAVVSSSSGVSSSSSAAGSSSSVALSSSSVAPSSSSSATPSSSSVAPSSSSVGQSSSSSATPSSSSSNSGSGTALDDTFKGPLTGDVTLTCNSQIQIVCYPDPSGTAFDITCGGTVTSIQNWASIDNVQHIGQCGSNGTTGGSLSCAIPSGKSLYCKKQ